MGCISGPVERVVRVWHGFAVDNIPVGHHLIAVMEAVVDGLVVLEVKLVVRDRECWSEA